MPKINVVNADNIIEYNPQKAYFKLKNTGGPTGPQGPKGDAATISVASTSTGAPGTSASVVNQGTSSDAQLAFTIPRGDKGEKGDKGDQGLAATVQVASTVTGEPGTDASVVNQGTVSNAVLKFTIPRGAKGDKGDKGNDGSSSTIAVGSTTTLPAGSSASVTNTGTASAAVLNFSIPQGVKGDKGDTGSQGPKGDPGAGLVITGSVATYNDLPTNLTPADAGKAYFVQADGKLYVWSGTSFPADGEGSQFEGPQGPQGETGSQGPAGPANSLAIGTVTTGQAAATITGTAPNQTLNLTIPAPVTMTGATGSADGSAGYVPAPEMGEQYAVLLGDGTWGYVDKWYYLNNDPTSANSVTIYSNPSVTGSPVEIQELLIGGLVMLVYSGNSGSQEKRFNVIGAQPDWQNGTATITLADESGSTIILSGSLQSSTATVSRVSPTPPDMTGATSQTAGAHGLVPAPAAGDEAKVLSGAGTWVNQPTMPTVNNGTLTIQHNGTSKGTFTANQSSNSTVNIETLYADTLLPASSVAPIVTDQIQDSAVTTAKLANAAVTSSKIDWSELKTGWIELSAAYGVKYKKVGKTVTLSMKNPSSMTLTGYTETPLVNATDGGVIAPSIELRFPVYGRNNTATYGYISTAGKVALFNWGAEASYEAGGLSFTVTYIID